MAKAKAYRRSGALSKTATKKYGCTTSVLRTGRATFVFNQSAGSLPNIFRNNLQLISWRFKLLLLQVKAFRRPLQFEWAA